MCSLSPRPGTAWWGCGFLPQRLGVPLQGAASRGSRCPASGPLHPHPSLALQERQGVTSTPGPASPGRSSPGRLAPPAPPWVTPPTPSLPLQQQSLGRGCKRGAQELDWSARPAVPSSLWGGQGWQGLGPKAPAPGPEPLGTRQEPGSALLRGWGPAALNRVGASKPRLPAGGGFPGALSSVPTFVLGPGPCRQQPCSRVIFSGQDPGLPILWASQGLRCPSHPLAQDTHVAPARRTGHAGAGLRGG